MRKFESIIEKLTFDRKIELLTDLNCLQDQAFSNYGIPCVKHCLLERESGDFPSFRALASSFDEELFYAVSKCEASKVSGAKVVETPDLKATGKLSEDPVLNGRLGKAMAEGVHDAGGAVLLNGLNIEKDDADMLDLEEDEGAIEELVIKPYRIASLKADAIGGELIYGGDGYENTNFRLFSEAREICPLSVSAKTCDADIHSFISGSILTGAAAIIDRAKEKHDKLCEFLNDGTVTERDFKGALCDGSAISEEVIDDAVDKVIDFAFGCAKYGEKNVESVNEPNIIERATKESFVLIKNEGNILPLKEGIKLAVIGDPPFLLPDKPAIQVYKPDGDINETAKAIRASANADVVLFFMSKGRSEEKLLASLKKNKPTVCVMTEPSYVAAADAIVLAPESKDAGKALFNLLYGKINFSGKLTHTLENAKTVAARRKKRDDKLAKVGVFTGYRYCSSAPVKFDYPFGFGLSYTSFVYSALKCENDKLYFTLKNVGNRSGAEVVQLYVSAPFTPQKVLKDFKRVELDAGESATVCFDLKDAFAFYDTDSRSFVTFGGTYNLYVSSSSRDEKLKCKIKKEGKSAPEIKRSDYVTELQQTQKEKGSGDESLIFKLHGLIVLLFSLGLVVTAVSGLLLILSSGARGGYIAFAIGMVAALLGAAGMIGERVMYARRPGLTVDAAQKPRATAEKKREVLPEKQSEGQSDEFIFGGSIDYAEVFSDLNTFLTRRGIVVDAAELRAFLAAISTSKLIIINGRRQKNTLEFLKATGEFFCGKAFIDSAVDYTQCLNIFYGKNTDERQFIEAVRACEETGNMNFAVLSHVDQTRVEEIFSPILTPSGRLEYSKGILQSKYKWWRTNMSAQKFVFPDNLFLIALSDGDRQYRLNACTLKMNISLSDEVAAKSFCKPIDFKRFEMLKSEVKEKFYLSEAVWKQFDRLEESAGVDYRINNSAWLDLEMFSSVYMACGGDESSAADCAVCVRFLGELMGDLGVDTQRIFNEAFLQGMQMSKAALKNVDNNVISGSDSNV